MSSSYRIFYVRLLSGLIHQLMILFGVFQIIKTQNSPLLAGLLGLFLFIPSLIVPLVAVQYFKRITAIGRAFVFTHLIYFVALVLILGNPNDDLILWYTAVFIASVARAIRVPFHYAILKQLPHPVGRLAVINNLSWQVPIVLAPLLLTGLNQLFGSISVKVCLLLLSTLVVSISLPLIKHTVKSPSLDRQPFLSEMKNQLRGTRRIWVPAGADLLIMMMVHLPVLIGSLLLFEQLPEMYFGPLVSFPMLVTILSVVMLAPKMVHLPASLSLGVSFLGIGVGLSVLLFAKGIFGLALGLLVIGLFDGVSIVVRDKLLIRHTSTANVGLIASLNAIFLSGSDELGQALTGLGLEFGGPTLNLSLAAGAAVALSMASFSFYFKPAGPQQRPAMTNN